MAAITLLVGTLIFPLLISVRKKLAELVVLKKELALTNGGNKISQEIGNRYRKVKINLDKVDALFVDPQAPVGLIRFWEKTAADYQLLIVVSPAALPVKKKDPWHSIGFQINLIGSFPNFLKFLKKTESSFYLVKSKNLIINKLEKDKNKNKEKKSEVPAGDLKANLLVQVFTK